MLCFLPPIPAGPDNNPAPVPAPRLSGTAAAVLVVLIALCAMLMPVAWPRHSPAPPSSLSVRSELTACAPGSRC